MASKTFLLLALALALVLLIASQVAQADDLTYNHDGEVDGRGEYDLHKGYDGDGHEGHEHDGHEGHVKGGGRGGYHGGGGKHGGCKYGCCRHYKHGGCKCCSTFEEATAYKQTQN